MSPPCSGPPGKRQSGWHNDRVDNGAETTEHALKTLARRVVSRPKLFIIPGIVLGFVVYVLVSDAVEIRVILAALILSVGSALGFKAEEPPCSYGLPHMPDGPPAPSVIPPKVYVGVSVVSVVLFGILQLFDLASWVSLALAIIAVIGWIIASDAVLRTFWHTQHLKRAMRSYGATTGIGFAGRSGGPWQLRMWEPYLRRSGERLVIFNLHEKYVEMILEGGDLKSPFIQLGSDPKADLDRLLVPSIKALFYVQNAQRNEIFMSRKGIVHVWLNHGDSDKPANFNPRHATYDRLVVCGQAGIDRYERHGIHVDPHKFDVLGRPQASGINPARGPIGTLDTKVVFYGPTWQGLDDAVNFSSLEKGPEIVRELIKRDVTVVFRPHPLSYRWRIRRAVVKEIHEILAADKKASGRQHVFGTKADKTWSVVDCTNASDALISDVSSVVSDFLQSEKPYAMMSMRASVDDFRAEFSVAETGYVVLGDLSNLGEMLDAMLGPDPLAEARSARKRYVLGDFTGDESAEAFAQYVRRLVGHTS